MKHFIQTSIITSLYLLGCMGPAVGLTQDKSSAQIQMEWLKAVQDKQDLSSFYSNYSGFLINDNLYTMPAAINQAQNFCKNFVSYQSSSFHQINENRKFELGEYRTEDGSLFKTIIGWRKKDVWTKEFESIYKQKEYTYSEIKNSGNVREQWEVYANSQQPEAIVNNLSTDQGIYFNRGMKFVKDEIIGAYRYMNNESFTIKLEFLDAIQVSEDVIFEVGSFDVGGKGLYAFVLRKVENDWKLLIDFNF